MGWKWANTVSDSRPTYSSWRDMRSRCLNPDNQSFPAYGGRGITVCDRWIDDYDAFVEDMGFRPDGLSIERIDNNGNYEPSNCRWASRGDQSRNKRSNVFHISGIIETDLAAQNNINLRTFRSRMEKWGDLQEALNRPVISSQKQSPHGSRGRYKRYACRCDLCKQANTEYGRRQRARRRG